VVFKEVDVRTLIGSEAADSARGRGGCRVKRQPVDRLLLIPGVVLVEFRPGLEAAAQDVDQSVGQLPKWASCCPMFLARMTS
jgi:hypothetical protein